MCGEHRHPYDMVIAAMGFVMETGPFQVPPTPLVVGDRSTQPVVLVRACTVGEVTQQCGSSATGGSLLFMRSSLPVVFLLQKWHSSGKYPAQTVNFESVNVPGLCVLSLGVAFKPSLALFDARHTRRGHHYWGDGGGAAVSTAQVLCWSTGTRQRLQGICGWLCPWVPVRKVVRTVGCTFVFAWARVWV